MSLAYVSLPTEEAVHQGRRTLALAQALYQRLRTRYERPVRRAGASSASGERDETGRSASDGSAEHDDRSPR